MSESSLIALSAIVILGIGAQWIAWRFRLPAVILLVLFGFVAGPLTNIVNPDQLFGEILLPIVSLSVAIILFEGGMNLRLGELRFIGSSVRRLVSVGLLITWILSTLAAYKLFNLDLRVASLLGAILVVTGPTVIIPLLRHVRPSGAVGSILQWEGIVIDPVGAIFALLVFQVVFMGNSDMSSATINAVLDFVRTILIGTSLGVLGAVILIIALWNFWLPDYLINPVVLMLVVGIDMFANLLQPEAGLLAATVMGVVLVNQHYVSVKKILEFKETLQVLLISLLFIILTARLSINEFQTILGPGLLFIVFLVVIVRPLAVFASTVRSGLKLHEKIYLSCIAPRGIVAIAVSSVFALRLQEVGCEQADYLVPITFLVVIGTVLLYSIIALPLARKLDLAQPNPQGVLIAGAHMWARELAILLIQEGYRVCLIDSNINNVKLAQEAGIPANDGNILTENAVQELDLNGIGRFLALTANDEVNSLATLSLTDLFGTANVYQLPLRNQNQVPRHLRGRFLFDFRTNYDFITSQFNNGGEIEVIDTKEEEEALKYLNLVKEDKIIPLFGIGENKELEIITAEQDVLSRNANSLRKIIVFVLSDEDEKKNRNMRYFGSKISRFMRDNIQM